MTPALNGRDRWRLQELLRDAPTDSISVAIFCGQYAEAGRLLTAYEADLPLLYSKEREELREEYAGRNSDAADLAEAYALEAIHSSHECRQQAVTSFRERLPAIDVPEAAEIAAETQRLVSDRSEDSFSTLERFHALVEGLRPGVLPAPLRKVAQNIRKKISAVVRARVRQQAGTPVVAAEGSDPQLWRLYHAPFRALDPLRGQLTYERFLQRADEVIGGWAVGHGASEVQYRALLKAMGVGEFRHEALSEDEIARLLQEKGGLQAALCWWEGEVRREETIVLIGVEGVAGARRFAALDGMRTSSSDLDALEASLASMEANSSVLEAWLGQGG